MGADGDAVRDALANAVEAIARDVPNARGTDLSLESAKEKATRAQKLPARDALLAVKRCWTTATHEPGNRLREKELAEVMRTFNEAWLKQGLTGTPLDDGTWSFRVARVNRNAAKRCLTALGNWARKGAWEPWTGECRKMRDEVMKKEDGAYDTYAQVHRGLEALRARATTGVRNLVNDGESEVTYEYALEFDKELQKWIETCWLENGLPPLDELPKSNEVFYASGMVHTEMPLSSKRAPPRDRSQPISPATAPAKKAKTTKDERLQSPVRANAELPRSVKKEPKEPGAAAVLRSPTPHSPTPCETAKPPARETEMHVIRHSVAVTVKVRCYGLDADLVIIPPFGVPSGVKTNGEMAAMVFRETQAAQQANVQPAESSMRCTHNDGKAWRCPGRNLEGTPFCTKHQPAKFSTLARVNPVTFETAQGLSITYAGPPSACVIRSVSGVPIDDSDLLMLKDPEKFEAFAWDIERQLKSCEGLVRRDGAGGRFRENAFVLERGGFWVPYTQYEARLTTLLPGTPPGSTTTSESVFNQCIEDIGAINTARVAEQANDDETEKSNDDDDKRERAPPAERPAFDDPMDTDSPGRAKVPAPTGAREVRLKLAELHRQLLNVDREIVGMRDAGFAHAKKRDPQSLDNSENSEYDAYEQSVNRALRL
jgi:hypothetical protein